MKWIAAISALGEVANIEEIAENLSLSLADVLGVPFVEI